MRTLTLDQAAARTGLSRLQLRESHHFTLLEDPRGARVLEADVVRFERQTADAEREDTIVAARRLVNLGRKVADDERWLDTMTAKGASSLALDQMRSRLAADKETLERLRAEVRGWDVGRRPSRHREFQSRADGELETQALKLRADRITRRFNEREVARDAQRAARTTRDAGLEPGWSDADWLSPRVQKVLRRFATRAHRRGKAYSTTLNGAPVAVLGSGRIVINERGA
jgi:hypothetical protein